MLEIADHGPGWASIASGSAAGAAAAPASAPESATVTNTAPNAALNGLPNRNCANLALGSHTVRGPDASRMTTILDQIVVGRNRLRRTTDHVNLVYQH